MCHPHGRAILAATRAAASHIHRAQQHAHAAKRARQDAMTAQGPHRALLLAKADRADKLAAAASKRHAKASAKLDTLPIQPRGWASW